MSKIDINFDFRRDVPPGADPDATSKALQRCHQLLWTKPLPSGELFGLLPERQYLVHRSSLGEFRLSSDTAVPTFGRMPAIAEWVSTEELAAFEARRFSIGGMILFPAVQVDGRWTINQARGCHRQIRDRFDLTLECIRLHYEGVASPLSDALLRYGSFFRLFGGFRGYVEFFLLQDLVTPEFDAVRFLIPFQDFTGPAVPAHRDAYRAYMRDSIAFIDARGRRMRDHG